MSIQYKWLHALWLVMNWTSHGSPVIMHDVKVVLPRTAMHQQLGGTAMHRQQDDLNLFRTRSQQASLSHTTFQHACNAQGP